MGINISEITNQALKDLALRIDSEGNQGRDGYNDGKLSGEEISIFETECNGLIARGATTIKEVNTLLGASEDNTTNPIIEVSEEASTKLSKKEKERNQEAVENKVKEYAKSGYTPSQILQMIRTNFSSADYRYARAEVEYVFNLLPQYNSKEDVEAIHDKVKKDLKAAGKWDGFHKELLSRFEDAAKTEQIQKEADELINKYNDIKRKMETTDLFKEKGHNFSEYVKTIKEELKAKDSNGDKAWKNSYTKEAFEKLENYARSDAQHAAEVRLNNSESHSKKGIRKEVLYEIEETSNDKYQKDAVKKSKTDRKILARRNTVEDKAADLTHMTKDGIAEEIGKRSNQYNFMKKMFSAHKIGDRIFEKLNRKYLDTIKNEDGTYDLSKLKDELLSRIGADYKLNQSTDDKMGELKNIQNHLKAITGEDFTDNETKVLVNMFDFKREHKDRTPGIVKALVSGAAAGASAFTSSPKVSANQLVEFTLKVGSDTAILEQLKEIGDVTQIGEGNFLIKVDQKMLYNQGAQDALKGLGIGALSSILFDFVIGDTKDEKSCMSISDYDIHDERYTNADKYKEYVAEVYKKSPAKVQALHILIDAYEKEYGENWHAEFQQKLRDVGGIGSKLNPEECRMLKYQQVEANPNPPKPEPQKPEPPKQEPPKPEPPKPEPPKQDPCELVYKEDIRFENSNKYYWDEIINMYYSDCLTNHSMKEIRYQLRKVNNIPNNYQGIPANLLLPQDLFGDGSCERLATPNKFKPSPLRKKNAPKARVKGRQTPQGGWYVGNKCTNRDGSSDITWDKTKYKDRKEAEKAGKQNWQ